ncbi:sperm associated antigen 8 [Scyliorhinus canicula]|uniref:sperm associated antigen 8 n=1 Tax=Scyliorhinus canicula TaxID=7830 RepID=UPI0018F3276A|nr:sperm associated antigen 8 [Scyliorhinus canicula]
MEQVVCDESVAGRLTVGKDGVGPQREGEEAGRGIAGTAGCSEVARPPGRDQDGCPTLSEAQAAREMPSRECKEDGNVQLPEEAGDGEAQEDNANRIKNKCLIGNWLEQRVSSPFDQDEEKATSHALAFKNGHKGLLSTDYLSNMSDITTYKDSYPTPMPPPQPERGIKKQLIEKYMYHKISKELFDAHEAALAFQPMEPLSVTGRDFKMEGFKSVPRPPTMIHNYKTEQPITIWSDHATEVHGVTTIKTGDTPFRKNTSFSKPIMETFDS